MRQRNSFFFPLVSVFIFIGIASVNSAGGEAASHEVTKIGVIVAQTGPSSWWGQQIVRGVTVAGEENDQGSKVKFVFEDDEFSAKNAVTAANKLIQHDQVKALLTFSGGPTAAVAEIAESNRVPLIGISAASAFTKDRRYAFRIFMSNESQMDLLTRRLDAISAKKIGLVTTTQESMLKFRDLFRDRNKKRLVFDEEVNPTDGDMKTMATRLKHSQADTVVFFVIPPNLAPLTRSLRAQHFTGPFLGGVNLFNPSEIRASTGALVSAQFPGPHCSDNDFTAKVRKRFGEVPASETLYAYDAAKLLIEGAIAGDILGSLNKRESMKGMAGNYRKLGQSFEVPARLWRITQSGEAELAGEM